ncbi:MAG TPA: APC family permease [Methanomassiliicoccales archaeon]|nr:APC family permease [Methanomassiliicoccales archaeon]
MAEQTGELKRSIGGLRLFVLAVASIVGPWLVMTNWWISLTGPSIALAFIFVGLMCIPIGLVYGELTAMFPQAGGSYVYIRKAFGTEATYWANWALMLSYTTVLAFQLKSLMSIIQYLWWPDMTTLAFIALALIIAFLVFMLNTREVSIGTGVQFVIFLVLAIVGFGYVSLFFVSPTFSTSNWTPFLQNGVDGLLTATALMVTMFFGFEVVPQFAEEAKYPVNKHWRPMVGAILFVILFDSAITLAESGMGSFNTVINTPMLGAQLALNNYGPWLQYSIALANIAALSGCLVGFWMGGSRILLAMGRSGGLPRMFAKVNKNKVPSTANYVIFGIVIMFILLTGQSWLASLFTLMAVGVGITYTGVSLSFIKLRLKNKDVPRPWRVPGGIVMGFLALVGSLLIAYFTFVYFTTEVWVLFVVYFAIVGVIRLALHYDTRKHPDKYSVLEEAKAPEPTVAGK